VVNRAQWNGFGEPSSLSWSFFKQGGRLRRRMERKRRSKRRRGDDGKSDSECDQGPSRKRRREGPRSNAQDGSYSAVNEDQELEQIYDEIAADWQDYHEKESGSSYSSSMPVSSAATLHDNSGDLSERWDFSVVPHGVLTFGNQPLEELMTVN
jgi:hypothetical protein